MHGSLRFLTADCVGALVPRRARGRVHSVFHRACNIEMHAGELVTLLASDLGDQPHGIRCASPCGSWNAELRPGQRAALDGGVLRVEAAGLAVDVSRASIWTGELFAAAIEAHRRAAARRQLRASLRGEARRYGFAPLLFAREDGRSALGRALGTRLARTLPAAARAERAGDAAALALALSNVVGLGCGLTPSGDDFIAGYLAALWSRAAREAHVAALLRALADGMRELAARTNAISRQLLLDAARGRFAQRLVEVVHALARGEDAAACVRRALESGHSSGADTLCGLWFGLSTAPLRWAHVRPPARRAETSVHFAAV